MASAARRGKEHPASRGFFMSNPKPQFGWFVKASAISIIALMLVAALRTAFSFGLSAFTSLNQFLALNMSQNALLLLSGLESLCAVLGIEGFIVTTGMKDGMRKSEAELGTPRAIAAYILLIVSCVAGLFQNAAMIADKNALEGVEVVLMIVTGLGVPISLMFASPYLGLMLNFQVLEERRWLADARKVFENSKERKLARSEMTSMQRPQRHEEVQSEQVRTRTGEIVNWYRQVNNLQPGDAISAAAVAEAFYKANNRVPVNGDFAKLAGAIRTHLSRERNGN
jgi:hypothetical protein